MVGKEGVEMGGKGRKGRVVEMRKVRGERSGEDRGWEEGTGEERVE